MKASVFGLRVGNGSPWPALSWHPLSAWQLPFASWPGPPERVKEQKDLKS